MAGTAVTVVLLLTATLLGAAEGVRRGPGDRANRMKNPRRSNVDMKALREKYLARYSEFPCTQGTPAPGDPPLPSVPLSFMTQMEFTMQQGDLQRVIHGVEMYDNPSRRGVNDYDLDEGVSLSRPTLLREEIHYNHNLDEALFVFTEDPCIITGEEGCDAYKYCSAKKIKDMNAAMQELLGIADITTGGEFMGAMGLMQFGPLFNYTYANTQSCRGARCNTFETCINKPDEGNASLLYTYYWTTDDWDVQNNGDSVPMALDIIDVRVGGITLHIDFFDFRRDWMPALDELEVPVDTYCEGRVTHISQPSPMTRCSYKSENVGGINALIPDGEGQTESVHMRAMFPQHEWYDYERRISRTDYIPFFVVSAARRFENFTREVMEFNQKLIYKVHPRLGTCSIAPINQNITWGDVVVSEDGSIQMMNPWNWEDLAEPMQYNGLHWERGMRADVWVGQKPSVLVPKLNETVVWYFASPFTDEIVTRNAKETTPTLPNLDKVPIKFEKYLSLAEALPHVVYHLYSFESNIPLTHNHDVSICFNTDQMRHFTFELPHDAIEKSLFLREHLKYAIQGSLYEAGNVSPLRINRLELNKTDTAVVVLFTLLEKPSAVADVDGDKYENTMDDAANAIRATIDSSQLIVLVKTGNTPDDPKANGVDNKKEERETIIASMTAKPHTMKEVTRDEEKPNGTEQFTGYSAGDMGGLAAGMIFLGLIMGFGGMYLYGRKK